MSANFTIELPYKSLHIYLRIDTSEQVSRFLESTIRGGFGCTMRKIVCATQKKECADCLLRNNCAYSYLFETAPSPDAARMKKYKSVPRPFTINSTQNGTEIQLNLTLIGNALSYLPYFIYTLNMLGRKGLGKKRNNYIVEKVITDGDKIVYTSKENSIETPLTPDTVVVYPGKQKTGTVEIHFYTPLVIRKNGAILKEFDTKSFFTTLLRRVTNLNAFHGKTKDININPEKILTAVDSLETESYMKPERKSRYSTRQNARLDYSGITGNVRLKGDTGTLEPLLKAGEILGVGKNTVFGYGKYVLNNI